MRWPILHVEQVFSSIECGGSAVDEDHGRIRSRQPERDGLDHNTRWFRSDSGSGQTGPVCRHAGCQIDESLFVGPTNVATDASLQFPQRYKILRRLCPQSTCTEMERRGASPYTLVFGRVRRKNGEKAPELTNLPCSTMGREGDST